MADDDDSISDAHEEVLLPSLAMPGGHNAETMAQQTAAAGLRKSQHFI
jgi:hypothetical protein